MKYEACPHCRQSHESTACNTSATSLIVTASSTTSTKTPRERFEETFSNVGFIPENKERYINFIETLLEEARQEMKEKMKKQFDFAIRAGMTRKEMKLFTQSL